MIRIELSTMVFTFLSITAMVYVIWRHFRNVAAMEEHASETLHRAYDKDGNFLGYVTEAGMDLINECQTQYQEDV
jgi:hypothetical protein